MTRTDAIIQIYSLREEMNKKGTITGNIEDALDIAVSDMGVMELLSQAAIKFERGVDSE